MTALTIGSLGIFVLVAAALYASVGHAGASGYLAVMALYGFAPEVMRPTALVLNIVVAAIATFKFYRAGCFSWRVFWPFALASVPFAFIGGGLTLPAGVYKPVVGLVLLFAALRLARAAAKPTRAALRSAPLGAALLSGLVIGLLSGLTGVGGGIFLSPLLLFMNWADTRHTAGISAAFILVNSVAGLLGNFSSVAALPSAWPLWAVAAVAGGWVGADYGSQRVGQAGLRRLLAVVLVIAGLKMMLA